MNNKVIRMTELLHDLTNLELKELLPILELEIRLSETAIKEEQEQRR